jgi:hypothetical protein
VAVGPATPFWLAPRTDLDLRSLSPAAVDLVAGPDQARKFATLKIGDREGSADVSISPEFTAKVDTGYRIIPGGLKVGAPPFGDRTFKIDRLPAAISGLTLLQTKEGHKMIVDETYSVTLKAAEPCYVFVAIDEVGLKTYEEDGAPSWLEEFRPTGHRLVTDNPWQASANCGYLVFVKKAPAGRFVLGPPGMREYGGGYFAFFSTSK